MVLPPIIQESNECKRYLHSFEQSREQLDLFNKRLQQKCKFSFRSTALSID